MSTLFAQLINPGASDSQDFQPPTQNPQSIGGQNLQQQEQQVTNTQEALNDTQTSDLRVLSTGQSLPAQPTATAVRPDILGPLLAAVLLIIIAIFILWIRKNAKVSKGFVSEKAATTTSPYEPRTNTDTMTTSKKPKTKKVARRKKQAKRKK